MLILHLACMKVDEKTIIQFKTARREFQPQSLNWCVVKTNRTTPYGIPKN